MEGSISKRKDGRWMATIEVPTITNKRVRKYAYGATRQECRKKMNKIIEEIERNGMVNPTKETFKEFTKKWLDTYCANLSPTTIDGYKRYSKYAYKYLGDAYMTKILPIHIQEMINNFSKTHSEKSCQNLLGAVGGVFKYAVLNKVLQSNPCSNIIIPDDTEKYNYYIYNEEEFNILLNYVYGTKEEIPILLAGLCGLRVSEVMGLTWNDIDFDKHIIYVRKAQVHVNGQVMEKTTKTRTSYRKIVAPAYVIERLTVYKNVGFVYPKKNGTAENGGNFTKRFARILKHAGLPHTRFHDLRHFNATMMLKKGIKDKEAAARLGHSDINMTKKYQHILSSMENESADILNGIVNSESEKMSVKMSVKSNSTNSKH